MPRYSLAFLALMAGGAVAHHQSLYGQCGGNGWTGPTSCVAGAHCAHWNDWYHQCVPSASTDCSKSSAHASPTRSTLITLTRPCTSTSAETIQPSSAIIESSSIAIIKPSSANLTSVSIDQPYTSASAATVQSFSAIIQPSFANSTLVTLTQPYTSTSAATIQSSSVVIESSSTGIVYPSSTESATSASSTGEVTSTNPSSASITSVPFSSAAATSTNPESAYAAAVSTTTSSATAASSTPSSGKTQYAGVNIAGFTFGCLQDGTCTTADVHAPITSSHNGTAQMNHFVKDDNLNAFRLPVSWQYLVNHQLGGELDSTNFGNYDQLVQGCLATGSLCIIDVHNYARWNGKIVGQGGPTNDQFAHLWTQLATKYALAKNAAFGIMNEPHDLTVSTWAETVQVAVTAIRKAGATSQLLLLPGNHFTSAAQFVSNGSGAALLNVTNPDGTCTGLVFDVHRYFDSDNSGTNAECIADYVSETWTPLATWLRDNKRQVFVSEIGGGNTASCEKYVCNALDYINANSDVYLGYTGWAAGSFDPTYPLALTPTGTTDTALMTKCFSRT